MRKPVLFTVSIILVFCSIGRGADCATLAVSASTVGLGTSVRTGPFSITAILIAINSASSAEKRLVDDLLEIARSKQKSLLVRTAALDTLGKLATNDTDAVRARLNGLKGLLHPSPSYVEDYEKNFYVLHVVQALDGIGPAARYLLPDLEAAKGNDPILDKAINAAIHSNLKTTPVVTQPPEQKLSNKVKNLIEILKDNTNDLCVRIVAAQLLGSMSWDGILGIYQEETRTVLDQILKDPNSDANLKFVAKKAGLLIESQRPARRSRP